MNDFQLVILMAGKATRLYPLTFGFPKCLLSVYQKPAIYNMLVPLISKGLNDITFVVNEENKTTLKDFMDSSFKNKNIKFNYIVQKDASGPGAALSLVEPVITKPTLILLGDTICEAPLEFNKSWIGVSKVDESSISSWCMVESEKDGVITKMTDKPTQKVNTNLAAIGIYFLKDYKLLKDILTQKTEKIKNEYQLSSIFDAYSLNDSLYINEFYHWNDIGTLENYRNTNSHNFNCRYFNQLSVNNLGTIKKKSNFEAITSEINWFKEIDNNDYKKITPTFYGSNIDNTSYEIEYYDYLTFSEYNIYYPITESNMRYMFNNLVSTMMSIYKDNKRNKDMYDLVKTIYFDKTYNRIAKWERKDLLDKEYITSCGTKLLGLNKCMELLTPSIDNLCKTATEYNTIIHGDLSFANILYSPRSSIFKLIDPRGNFGIDTIYGDYRYDLSKLRHCYHGRYDEIVNDLFEITEDKEINLTFFKDNYYEMFDSVLCDHGIEINDIELIEGLLFISMIPLHSDYPNRQLAFFIRGLTCLNNQINRRQIYGNN